MVRVRGMKNEAFKIELSYTAQFRPRFEGHIGVIADAVVAFEKADFGIEVGADFAMLSETFEPTVLVGQACANISLSRRKRW